MDYITPFHNRLSTNAAPTSHPTMASQPPLPKGGCLPFFSSHKIIPLDPQSTDRIREEVQVRIAEKFPVTPLSRFWSGTRITIPIDQAADSPSLKKGLTFQGTEQEAQELLKQLVNLQGKGSLILKRTSRGAEFQYKNFSIQSNKKQNEQTADYIASLVKAAYSHRTISTELQQRIGEKIANYLSPIKDTRLNERDLVRLKSVLKEYDDEIDAALEGKIEVISEDLTPIEYLKIKKHVEIETENLIGSGSFGKVYAAKIEPEHYVYKMEKDAMVLSDDSEFNGKFWRHGDIAAARLQDLPHFAKSVGFILKVTEPECPPQQWYVSTDMTKDFGKSLPKGTKIELLSQLIKRAPGKELSALLQDQSFKPLDHFNSITIQLFEFLEKAYARNLIHRDLKPANCMYDPETRKLTVIDFGLGGVYGKRKKLLANSAATKTNSGNLLRSTMRAGTPKYLAPAVAKKEPYGSEIDFYSVGLILIKLLEPKAFEFYNDIRKKLGSGATFLKNTKQYFNILLDEVSPSINPPTRNPKMAQLKSLYKTLNENPNMRKTIDLVLNVAELDSRPQASGYGGYNSNATYRDEAGSIQSKSEEAREAAFQELKTHIENVVRPAALE